MKRIVPLRNVFFIGFFFLVNACNLPFPPSPTSLPDYQETLPALGPKIKATHLPVQEEYSGPWKLVRHVRFGSAEPVYNRAAFWDDSLAFSVGRKKGVYLSLDGGTIWQQALVGYDTCGFGIEIVSPEIIWSCAKGQNGGMDGDGWNFSVRVSLDGGVTWRDTTRIPTEYNHASARCWDLSFINDQIGWVSSFGQISATQDGGKTWSDIEPPTSNIIVSNFVLNNTDVFLLDDEGGLYLAGIGERLGLSFLWALKMGKRLLVGKKAMGLERG